MPRSESFGGTSPSYLFAPAGVVSTSARRAVRFISATSTDTRSSSAIISPQPHLPSLRVNRLSYLQTATAIAVMRGSFVRDDQKRLLRHLPGVGFDCPS